MKYLSPMSQIGSTSYSKQYSAIRRLFLGKTGPDGTRRNDSDGTCTVRFGQPAHIYCTVEGHFCLLVLVEPLSVDINNPFAINSNKLRVELQCHIHII